MKKRQRNFFCAGLGNIIVVFERILWMDEEVRGRKLFSQDYRKPRVEVQINTLYSTGNWLKSISTLRHIVLCHTYQSGYRSKSYCVVFTSLPSTIQVIDDVNIHFHVRHVTLSRLLFHMVVVTLTLIFRSIRSNFAPFNSQDRRLLLTLGMWNPRQNHEWNRSWITGWWRQNCP